MKNVLEAGLNNLNPIGHPTPTLLNIGRIENTGDFRLFSEGFSPSVIRTEMAVWKEREDVMSVLGLESRLPVPEMLLPVGDFLRYRGSDTTPSMGFEAMWLSIEPTNPVNKHRFLVEDVPYGMVPYASIGSMLGVKTPCTDAIIQIASVVCQKDFWIEGRTVDKLEIDGMDAKKIFDFLYKG